jgi:hypothetical protein
MNTQAHDDFADGYGTTISSEGEIPISVGDTIKLQYRTSDVSMQIKGDNGIFTTRPTIWLGLEYIGMW